jgi:hypothetical protein
LPSGTWTVRDVLCHLAARSNGVPRFVERIKNLVPAGGPGAPSRPAFDIDEINQGQIDERAGRSVEELLDEIVTGHKAAAEALSSVDAALLSRRYPNFRGDGQVEGADMLLNSTTRHDNTHLDEIEEALKS